MSKYFSWPTSLKRFIRFDAARANDMNAALDELTTGLSGLEGDVNRSLKLPIGTADQTLALAPGVRANKVVAFDGSGNITVSANDVDTSAVSAATAATQAGIATTQVGLATTQAGIATTQAGIATTQASNASTSASAAAISAASSGIPSIGGNALLGLRVNAGATGVEWAQPVEPFGVGDIVTSAGVLGLPKWLPCDQTLRLKASFVALSAALPIYPAFITTTPSFGLTGNWNGLTYGGGVWVAFPIASGTVARSSTDGITWTARSMPAAGGWLAAVYAGGQFVAIANNSPVATSPNGITWTDRPAGAFGWTDIIHAAGLFVITGNGVVVTSADGITWTSRTVPALSYTKIAYGAGLFVAFATTGAYITSPDGITWTTRTLIDPTITRVVFGNGVFVASGAGGSLLYATSRNGTDWMIRAFRVAYHFIGFAGGIFIASPGGSPTALAISQTGLHWGVDFAISPGGSLSSLAFDGTAWLATTTNSTQFLQRLVDPLDPATQFRLPPALGAFPQYVRAEV